MNIYEFTKQNPNHPLTEAVGIMQADCTPEVYAYLQGVAGGIVVMLCHESHVNSDQMFTMLAEIGTPVGANAPTTKQ